MYGFEGRLAVSFFDHGFQLFGTDAAGYDVVGEDLVEGILVFRLEEGWDGVGGEFGEGVIRGSEDGKGAGAAECVDEAAGFDGCDEGGVDGRVRCVLHDGLGGIHLGAADHGVLLG